MGSLQLWVRGRQEGRRSRGGLTGPWADWGQGRPEGHRLKHSALWVDFGSYFLDETHRNLIC